MDGRGAITFSRKQVTKPMCTTRIDAHIVCQHLLVEVTLVEGGPIPVPAELRYDSSDPYAVTIAFHALGDAGLSWTFARDLLSVGLTQPIGDGDVHVWPCLNGDGDRTVTIGLCSPHGSALVEVPARDAIAFVERNAAIVAPGKESAFLDLDATITAIRAADAA